MRIWLDQVQEEPFSWDQTEKVDPASLERPELVELSPIAWRGQVVFTDPGYYLRARLSYEQTLSCTRCLKDFRETVSVPVELMIEVAGPRAGNGERGEHELHEDDLGVLTLQEEILDTDPILREQLQLNIPMKPLCRPDCAGLCPACGADRNEGDCGCAERTGDPGWAAALAALRDRLEP
jgi:uncharacterized protein